MTTHSRTGAHAARRPAVLPDGGFTLVEVIVALTLLALLSTAALYFFVSGSRAVTHQQRSHGAVSAANDAMEQVFSYVPQMAGSTVATTSSGLLVGRLDSDVTAAWSAAAARGIPGIAETYPGWDRAAAPAPQPGGADDRIKLVRTVRSSGVTYDVTTLIGYCYRVDSNPNAVCTRVGGDSIGNPNPGYVRMLRSIVVVSWPGTTSSCVAGTCSYQIQSLIDPNSDLKWNNTTRLQSFDDAVQVNAGESVTIDVLANDSVMELSSNPVSKTSEPMRGGTPVGTATVDTSSGKIVYQAPADGWGEVTFGYRVEVGARITQATVHAYVTPKAPDLSASVRIGQVVELPVVHGSGVTAGSLTLTQAPGAGSVSMPSGVPRFRYQAPATAGTYQFRYTFRDSTNTTSLVGVATVTVYTYDPGLGPNLQYPLVTNPVTTWPAQSSAAARTLDVRANSGNPTGYRTIVRSLPTGGSLNVALNNPVTGALTWTQPANSAGAFSFTYQVVAPDGSNPSPTGTVTLLVPPVANNQEITIKRSTSKAVTQTVTLTSYPASGMTFTRTSSPSCSPNVSVKTTSSANGATQVVEVPRSAGATTCKFTFTTSVATAAGVLTSAPGTVTVKVTT
ncbi:prepilin-type N-terminal cleavage/methylation domain-containing protein [Cellulomonas sp. Sa3CUA2]|uniref:Prepilin-type N-terminal cleavage/methylation domain-containing protein n=1 Tax=Cellulomonas avistercoris TaxID=2762242 RepID=A0ABR8Q8T3_9CELL|nr:prepilin-type N-terminal cleavage/methylation domain-containing protein [Cellulomonas avistercoris]MBD7916837.1 prepilin-type N-terminal cleavage/methylation domain-containing protein [Cellulomonas avistercoris]